MRLLGRGRILIGSAVTLAPGGAHACAVCVGWGDSGFGTLGFYWSALLLSLLPFSVVAIIGAWVHRASRRKPPEDIHSRDRGP